MFSWLGGAIAQAQQGGTSQSGETSTTGGLSHTDHKFVSEAARGSLEEVQLGQLAQQKGANTAVREFGQRMMSDHTKLSNELQQLASQKGLTVPTSLSHHEQSTLQHLQSDNGAKFDQAYARQMVQDHEKDLKEFEREAKDAKDPALKSFAQQSIPILRQHLQMARNMEASVKNEK